MNGSFDEHSIYTLLTGKNNMSFIKQNWLNELSIMIR